MSDKPKTKFILCPRCELNYIPANDENRKYCDVCLAELNLIDPSVLIPDEDAELEVLCPVCKVNYMSPDEEMCFMCQKEANDKILKEETETPENWNGFDDEEPLVDDEDEPLSLSELAEEEEEAVEDESFDDDTDTMDEDILDEEEYSEDLTDEDFEDEDYEDDDEL